MNYIIRTMLIFSLVGSWFGFLFPPDVIVFEACKFFHSAILAIVCAIIMAVEFDLYDKQ